MTCSPATTTQLVECKMRLLQSAHRADSACGVTEGASSHGSSVQS